MALNRADKYGTRWEAQSTSSPSGKFKNKTTPTDTNASYLDEAWINDIADGWHGAILQGTDPDLSGVSFPSLGDGNQDTAQDSQVYKAWYKKTQDIADTRISASDVAANAEGCFFHYYNKTKITPTVDGADFYLPMAADENDIFSRGSNVSFDVAESTYKGIKVGLGGLYNIIPCIMWNTSIVGTTFQLKKTNSSGTINLLECDAKVIRMETSDSNGTGIENRATLFGQSGSSGSGNHGATYVVNLHGTIRENLLKDDILWIRLTGGTVNTSSPDVRIFFTLERLSKACTINIGDYDDYV